MNHAQFWGGGGAAPYAIDQSLRFNSADSYTFRRTPGSNSTSQKKFTVSAWVKRGLLASGSTNNVGRQGIFYTGFANGSGNMFGLEWNNDGLACIFNGGGTYWPKTVAKFRDPSAWYHIVAAVDTAQATTADRLKLYVNGVEQTLTGTLPTQDFLVTNGTTSIHSAGENGGLRSNEYLAEFYYINDQQLTPGDFGELNNEGVWIPKEYAGTFTGTNSCYLTFDPSATNGIGHDHSGNGNNFTPSASFNTSGTGTDVMSDTPTTNWCTWNPLRPSQMAGGSATISNGNLNAADAGTSYGVAAQGTIAVSSGKWYWEIDATTVGGSYGAIGIRLETLQGTDGAGYFYGSNGGKGTSVYDPGATAYGNSYTSGDNIGVALDLTNGKIWFAKNGTWQASGNPAAGTNEAFSGLSGMFSACVGDGQNATSYSWDANFGQRAFAYTPPTGFNALNTANLPAPGIADPSLWFDVKTHVGSTTGAWFTLGQNFDIDFIWTKNRTGAYNHVLVDSVRGDNNSLASNTTAVENTAAGVLLGTGANSKQVYFNGSVNEISNTGQTYVDWLWKEGATPGFDIITGTTPESYAANTYSHNLGVVPSFIIYKERPSTSNWWVWHKNLPNAATGRALNLNTTSGEINGAYWGTHTNTVVATAAGIQTGLSAGVVIYAFAEIEGYSKFGSYTGNGLADGPCVHCGFKPRFLLIKGTNSGSNWEMIDTARDPDNVANQQIFANLTIPYPNYTFGDVVSNGFKIRDNSSGLQGNYNTSGQTYIFAAFAEHPFGGNGVSPATAR